MKGECESNYENACKWVGVCMQNAAVKKLLQT